MPLQLWWFIKMPHQFPNFEKCHCNFYKLWKTHSRLWKMPLEMAFLKVWKLQWHFSETPDFEWHLSNEPKTKITGRAAGSLVAAARCAILLFIDYVDNGMGPRCQKSIRRNHFFAWNKETLACILPWPWWVPAIILNMYNHLLIVYAST